MGAVKCEMGPLKCKFRFDDMDLPHLEHGFNSLRGYCKAIRRATTATICNVDLSLLDLIRLEGNLYAILGSSERSSKMEILE